MKIVEKSLEIKNDLNKLKADGKTVGFVPTMGALHQGHLSLIEKAGVENDVVVVSIFVNPTQFNNPSDFEKYPRILEKDIEILKTLNCDFLFVPSEKEMYPKKDTREFDFGGIDKVMEGKFRPGHFRGVALIVSKLFDIVNPHKAYFGEKDFQQVAIIRHISRELNYDIDIVSCPIIREEDGLAMSSRNMRLTKEQREEVSLISQTLFKAVEKRKNLSVSETKDWVIRTINGNSHLEVEYFEIVDALSLKPILEWSNEIAQFGCIAVHVGSIRLIDNIRFNS